jgi:hypothetical protein
MTSYVGGKLRSLHSGISFKNTRLFMFEAHLPAENPHWLVFSKIMWRGQAQTHKYMHLVGNNLRFFGRRESAALSTIGYSTSTRTGQ